MKKFAFNRLFVLAIACCCCQESLAAGKSLTADLNTLAQSGKYQEAQQLAQKLLGEHPEQSGLHLWYANLARKTGQTGVALSHYQKACQLDPRLVEAHVALAEIYLQNLDVERSLAQSRAALKLAPDNMRAAICLVGALSQTDRIHEGQEQIDRLLRLDPKNSDVLWLAYQMQIKKGDYVRARPLLEQAIAVKPQNTLWLMELAELEESSGDTMAAQALWRQAVQEDPGSAQAHLKLARNLEVWSNQYDQAIAEYQKALSLGGSSNVARAGLERCRAKKNNLALRLKMALRSWLYPPGR